MQKKGECAYDIRLNKDMKEAIQQPILESFKNTNMIDKSEGYDEDKIKTAIKEHDEIEKSYKEYNCPHCKASFQSEHTLNNHIVRFHK